MFEVAPGVSRFGGSVHAVAVLRELHFLLWSWPMLKLPSCFPKVFPSLDKSLSMLVNRFVCFWMVPVLGRFPREFDTDSNSCCKLSRGHAHQLCGGFISGPGIMLKRVCLEISRYLQNGRFAVISLLFCPKQGTNSKRSAKKLTEPSGRKPRSLFEPPLSESPRILSRWSQAPISINPVLPRLLIACLKTGYGLQPIYVCSWVSQPNQPTKRMPTQRTHTQLS